MRSNHSSRSVTAVRRDKVADHKRIDVLVDQIEQYAKNQRRFYDGLSGEGLDKARDAVAPEFDRARRHAQQYVHHVLNQFYLRRGTHYLPGRPDISKLKVLDFGCGVGRVMEAFHEAGVGVIDGCDISQGMLDHAAQSTILKNSRFFLGNGYDIGSAPQDNYDIAYGFLVFHHIPMRQTRIEILRALSKGLNKGGMIFLELKIYPGVTAARIPRAHAHWTENVPAAGSNSDSDVFVTPDALGLVYEDFKLFFYDVNMTEFHTGEELHQFQPDSVYGYGFNELHVSAQKEPSFKHFIDKGFPDIRGTHETATI